MSASCDDKLKITKKLHAFNVDYIEAGWPGSNPKDAEFFERAKTELSFEMRNKLVAFGSTRRKGIRAEDDAQIAALLESRAPTVCIVAKAHVWQVTDILRATPEENLEMIRDSVAYLTSQGRRVFVDLEHFYDGYKYNEEYALQCCEAAADAGAKCLVLCDTNGGNMPWQVESTTRKVVQYFVVLITAGEKGSSYSMSGSVGHIEAVQVNVMETTGAGDAFMAGFLHGLLSRGDIGSLSMDELVLIADDLVQFMTVVGTLTCMREGAIAAQPLFQEVESFLTYRDEVWR